MFALARNAMYAACKILGLGPGDEVLTPAFDCDGALQPFTAIGCRTCFFKSDPLTFAADVEDIRRRITPATRLIHIVNHFGIPQPWDKLLELRKSSGIPILEDNAYSLFSVHNGRLLGEFGDLSVFSFRKNLPVVDGGMLRINDHSLRFDLPLAMPVFFSGAEYGHAVNILKRKLGCYKLPRAVKRLFNESSGVFAPVPLFSEQEGFPEVLSRDRIPVEFACDYLRPMSKLAFWQLCQYTEEDLREISEKKREYYSWLIAELNGIPGLRPLIPELPEGSVPFCVFLMADGKRDMLYEELSAKYEVLAWPTFSGKVLARISEFPEVRLLGRKLLQLNLSSDRVRQRDYPDYLKRLAGDIRLLAERCLR